MLIAIVNTKGGVGKTTTAMLLASEMAARGRSVEVRDLDPSSSALRWADLVEEGGSSLPFRVVPSHASRLHRPSDTDFVVVDTAPSNKADIATAVEYADFVVVPTRPGQAELERTQETIRYLDLSKCAVLLTCVERTVSTRVIREQLDGKVSMFETEIPKREDLRRAYGNVPGKTFGYDRVLDELLEALGESE